MLAPKGPILPPRLAQDPHTTAHLPHDFGKSCREWVMGGHGSGRRWRAKPETDGALRLDVRWLVRQGLIQPGIVAWMPVQWTRNGVPDGSVQVSYDARRPDELLLDYQTRALGQTAWTAVHEIIALERTPCHYGGERVWCRCPGCGSRRAVLYNLYGGFRCVPCTGLAYSSTRDDRLAQLNRRAAWITQRLHAEPDWVGSGRIAPCKPKGMHWRTYDRLVREWRAIQAEAESRYETDFSRLIASTDRVLAERRGH